MIGSANINTSIQNTEQTNINEQRDSQLINNQTKEENIQDYTTYIRTTDRNITEMENNLKTNLEAIAKMKQSNTINLTGCITVNKDTIITQQNNVINNVKAGLTALQNMSDTLKQAASTESTTNQTAQQTAGTNQAAEASTEQGSTQEESSEQEVEQTAGFRVVGRLSPVRVSETFTNLLNRYKLLKVQPQASKRNERFGLLSNNRRKVESFGCLIGCANVNTSIQDIKQRNENRQISEKVLNNNSEIKNKITSAYDKIAEVINETRKTEAKAAEAKASADTSQSNELNLGIDPIKMSEIIKAGGQATACQQIFEGELRIEQKNELELLVELDGMIEQISSMDQDQETAAIMADMMGLTQAGTVEQAATGKTEQTNKQTQKATQTAKQTAGALSIGGIILLIIIGYLLYKMFSTKIHPWFKVVNEFNVNTLVQQGIYPEAPVNNLINVN